MKQSVLTRILTIAAATVLCAACIAATACSSATSSNKSTSNDALVNTSDTSGGIAATVNGVEIGENVITAYVEAYRVAMSLDDEDSWGEWLVQYGYTPEDIRSDTITYYENQELMYQAADEWKVTVPDSDVEEQVESVRGQFETEEEWQEALTSSAMTEDSFKEYIRLNLLEEALIEAIGVDAAASDDDVLASVQEYAPYYDGSKRSSHILFDAENEQLAQEVLDKVESGEMTFEEAIEQYADNESVLEAGDVGWDQMTTFVDEYQDALDALEVGEISGLVTSEYGIHIIECTDKLVVPDEITSLDDITEGFVETIRETLDADEKEAAYDEWMTEFENKAEIEENDMPEGLPYDIDLTPYEEAAAAEAEAEDADAQTDDDTSTDGDADNADSSEE